MKYGKGSLIVHLTAVVTIPLLLALAGPAAAHEGPAITPELVEETIADGTSTDIEKTIHTPAIPPNPEICFLADTTGSMSVALANVQANIGTIMSTVASSASGTSSFCAAQYRDVGDTPVFSLDQALTTDQTAVNLAVGGWSAFGGGDDPEDQLHALTELAGAGPGWSPTPPATHIIVWFGDCPGHDPASGGETLASTIAALTTGPNGPIRVIAVSVDSGFEPCAPDFLNQTGQASSIASATSGVFLVAASANDVSDAVLEGLSNLPIEVAMASNCASETGGVVSTSFIPPSQVVTSGDHAVFTETISVSATPEQEGMSYECDDWATIDDEPMTDAEGEVILEHKIITVPDTTPPEAACTPTTNPSGQNIPSAPGNGGQGQNQDGFYEVTASDNVDVDTSIFLVDSVSGETFGPFSSGTQIKLTQAPGKAPDQKPGPGVVDWHITIQGDAIVFAVDDAGNVSSRVACLVPPPPQ